MKAEKELQEVWEMKKKAWEETKDLRGKELLDFIRNDTKNFRESLLQTTPKDNR